MRETKKLRQLPNFWFGWIFCIKPDACLLTLSSLLFTEDMTSIKMIRIYHLLSMNPLNAVKRERMNNK